MFVLEGIVILRGLVVDYNNGYIYWVDDFLDMIVRINIEGEEFEVIRYGSRYLIFYVIIVFEDFIIWVDRNLKKIFKVSKELDNIELLIVIRDNINWLRDVIIFDKRV